MLACVGEGSNAISAFANFASLGLETGKHVAPLATGEPGMIHGFRSYLIIVNVSGRGDKDVLQIFDMNQKSISHQIKEKRI